MLNSWSHLFPDSTSRHHACDLKALQSCFLSFTRTEDLSIYPIFDFPICVPRSLPHTFSLTISDPTLNMFCSTHIIQLTFNPTFLYYSIISLFKISTLTCWRGASNINIVPLGALIFFLSHILRECLLESTKKNCNCSYNNITSTFTNEHFWDAQWRLFTI